MGVYDLRSFLRTGRVVLPFGADDIRIDDGAGGSAGTDTAGESHHREPDGAVSLNGVVTNTDYVKTQYPMPVLIGRSARERAEINMWRARVETGLIDAAAAYRAAAAASAESAANGEVRTARRKSQDQALHTMHLLDRQLADRRFIIGERYSIADITAFRAVDFARASGIAMPDTAINLKAWYARISDRPGARA